MLVSAWWNSLWEILKQITVFLVCYHLHCAGAKCRCREGALNHRFTYACNFLGKPFVSLATHLASHKKYL